MPDTIGKYRVIERIGRGGMGTIFKAHDPVLDRLVALKVISTEVEVTDEMRTRFFREAQACAKLNHPNIVTVYDMGEDDGRLFIVMELLEGQELRRLISQGAALPLEDKLSVMTQVCGGLHYAHQRGIVHRDVKPGNIFVLTSGQVKILDFGIAHMAATEGLTRTGLIMGTLRYISPEQVRGRSDARSDMFSLGSVFYELLSSRPPFTGDDPMHLLEQLRAEDPPALSELDATLPSALTGIVQRAMRKNPTERFRDLDEMRTELERVQREVQEARHQAMARVRGQRERIAQLQTALAERLSTPARDAEIPGIDERRGLVGIQALEQDLAGRIATLEAEIAQTDAMAPVVQRAEALMRAGQYDEAAAEFEAIVEQVPAYRWAHEGLERARAEADLARRRRQAADLEERARAALRERRYALCLEILQEAADLQLPADLAQGLASLRERVVAEQEALPRRQQEAEEAATQTAAARAAAHAEDAVQYAAAKWNEAQTLAGAAEASLRRGAHAEAKEGFDRAVAAYQAALEAARNAQAEERRTAERAREAAALDQQQARAAGAAQYATELWNSAGAKLDEAQAAFAKKPTGRVAATFTEASGLYRRAKDAAQGARDRERRRAEAARGRADEGRRSATALDAEGRAPALWQEATDRSAAGEAAWLRGQYAAATEAFEAALGLYHQAQAQVRDAARRQREESARQQQKMAASRREAAALEAVVNAPAEWAEAEACAATAEAALERNAWDQASAEFERATELYRIAEVRARETREERGEAERALAASGVERAAATAVEASRYAVEAWKAAEDAEARAVAAFSQQRYDSASALFGEAEGMYADARHAAEIVREAEANRVEGLLGEARRLLDSANPTACLERVNTVFTLRPGHPGAEALRVAAQAALRAAEARADATVLMERPAGIGRDADQTVVLPAPPTVEQDASRGGTLDRDAVTLTPRPSPLARQWTAHPRRLLIGAAAGLLALAAVVAVGLSWRSQPSPAPSPAPAPAPAPPRPAAPAVPRAAEPPPAPDAAETPRSQATASREEAARAETARAAAALASRTAEVKAAEGQAAEARRAAELAEAPTRASSLWAKAGTAQRNAEDAFKRQAFDKARGLFGDARKGYQDAERAASETVAAANREQVAALKRDLEEAEKARRSMVAARQEHEAVSKQVPQLFAAAQRLEADGDAALNSKNFPTARQRFVAAQDAYKRAGQEGERVAAEAKNKAAAAEEAQKRQAALAEDARRRTEAMTARGLIADAKKAAADVGAERHAQKLLAAAQTKEREGQAALDKSDYPAADRLFRAAVSDYQNAAREADLQVGMLKSGAEQSKSRAIARRDQAVKAEADRLVKDVFDGAQAKQTEAETQLRGQNFTAAAQSYQDAADRYVEAGMKAQVARDSRSQADAARAKMLGEKQKAKEDAADYRNALNEERQGTTFYERLAFKEAAEKFQAAERLFSRSTAASAPPSPAPGPSTPSTPSRRAPPPF